VIGRIRVLVVDDSAFARRVLREILSRCADIEVVGTARDGLDALEQVALLAPDVLTLDLEMPQLDGLGLLASLPSEGAPRVVVVSTASDQSDSVVSALQAGAITAVHKPTALATDRLYEMSEEVVLAVRRAAQARSIRPAARLEAPVPLSPSATSPIRLVAIGASTGGPQVLTRLLAALPATFPVPIAVVLHMPIGYTEAFASRLNELCALEVLEATDGMRLKPGRVIVARAGLHLSLDARAGGSSVRLDVVPLDSLHRPAVDVLFSSAASVLGNAVLGVVLTGMGDDGLGGARSLTAAGGRVITQSARSCVIYGMPRCVVEAGLSTEQVDAEDLPEALVRLIGAA
jgi:two-component system chemotaxis response regulator CheB